ncbi:ROK family protein [Rhodococcus koreensis]
MSQRLDQDSAPVVRALAGCARTKAQLVEATGWSRNTVGSRLERLRAAGWIVPLEPVEGDRGRPSTRYRLSPDLSPVFVASFGSGRLEAAICTLGGEVLAADTRTFSFYTQLSSMLDLVEGMLGSLHAKLPPTSAEPSAAVIGMPSPGANPAALNEALDAAATAEEFSARLGMPATFENDVNLIALGAARRLAMGGEQPFAYVKVASGIGAGTVISGQLLRGVRGLAGEIGHTPVPSAAGRICSCGNDGCVVEVAGLAAILAGLRARGKQIEDVAGLAGLVQAGDADAILALRQAGRNIGEALVGFVTALAPELVLVGGAVTQMGDHLITGVRESIFARTLPALGSQVRIESSADQHADGLRGACLIALERLA